MIDQLYRITVQSQSQGLKGRVKSNPLVAFTFLLA